MLAQWCAARDASGARAARQHGQGCDAAGTQQTEFHSHDRYPPLPREHRSPAAEDAPCAAPQAGDFSPLSRRYRRETPNGALVGRGAGAARRRRPRAMRGRLVPLNWGYESSELRCRKIRTKQSRREAMAVSHGDHASPEGGTEQRENAHGQDVADEHVPRRGDRTPEVHHDPGARSAGDAERRAARDRVHGITRPAHPRQTHQGARRGCEGQGEAMQAALFGVKPHERRVPA